MTRSLIVLKSLTYAPTGGMAAAPTTSLPEFIGGPRNWDYRFCWLRDATLTLLSLMNAGYYDEAQMWREWLLRAAAGSPRQIQIMYGLRGERRLTEWEVPWLPGYENSAPVRIGNAAHSQLQLDIFGEVMDALHQARQGGLGANEAGWAMQREFLLHLAQIWHEPDEGLWEVRSGREHFTHSKVMAWLAFDRAIRSAEMFKLPGPIDAVARDPRANPRRRMRTRLRHRRSALSSAPMARKNSTPASCCCRRSGFCRRTMLASSLPSRRSSAVLWSTAWCSATTARRQKTACRPARACSLPAASGSPTPI